MDAQSKMKIKAQLTTLSAVNMGFKSMVSVPPGIVLAGMPPTPVILQPVLAPYLNALQTHADNFDKLIKVITEMVDKSWRVPSRPMSTTLIGPGPTPGC